MRGWRWMMCGVLAAGLTGCGPGEPPPLPDDVTTEQPVIDPGTLVDEPAASINSTDPDSEAPPFDPGSDAPAFDPNSEAPAFDPGPEPAEGTESSGTDPEPTDPPPVDSGTSATPRESNLFVQLSDPERRDTAVESIRTRGADAVPEILAALDDPDWQVRAGAVFALSTLGPQAQAALSKLQTLAETEDHESVRDAAAWAIDAIAANP